MWYKNAWRRHLCDMHIDDWNDELLSQLSPEDYVNNLKTAKIQNAMLYFQSHVGLCYYPTASGKMHNSFVGKEDTMRRIADLCHEAGISVTGYYSLIYNNWAHDNYPSWRMIDLDGKSLLDGKKGVHSEFANNDIFRYGLCCPNNMEYRAFVAEQIKEMADYFDFEGMFFDMLFWPHMCYCDSCKKRWEEEVGGSLPEKEDWNDERWLLHIEKRREWMGEFAQWATAEIKSHAPNVSVEHNFACAVLSDGKLAIAEPVNEACDYVGGDLYGGIYRQSFTCKYYRNITKNPPFEYMFSRCEPNLEKHTTLKSYDVMLSSVFLTAAHHGATLVIDAIDPVGTLDSRVYEQISRVFEEEMPYEPYFVGDMIEDVGVYYTLRSKFNKHNEAYTNHLAAVQTVDNMIFNNVCCGVTGGYHDINKYKTLIASCLTDEDEYDAERIVNYVKNGGNLYLSGADSSRLLKEFFGAECTGRTKEKIVYIAPNDKAGDAFDRFNSKYPLHFDGTAPIVSGLSDEDVIATITLPYTHQDTPKFVSIHSNPPGVGTEIPAMAIKKFGKGIVFWSALPIECIDSYEYRRIFLRLLRFAFPFEQTVCSNAPKDVEVVAFKTEDSILINTVLLNEDYHARRVEDFSVSVKCDVAPKEVSILPDKKSVEFEYKNGEVTFSVKNLKIFDMYELKF